MEFYDFYGPTRCGATQRLFEINKAASDYIPRLEFFGTKFSNVAVSNFAYFFKPPRGWANITDCGKFPCTAPSNVVMDFKSTVFEGSSRLTSPASFQVVSQITNGTADYKDCKEFSEWRGWHCTNDKLGVLLFESLDGDTEDRSVQPIDITNSETKYFNRLNSMMDHEWDGFYTGQHRLSRFPAQIQTDQTYTV